MNGEDSSVGKRCTGSRDFTASAENRHSPDSTVGDHQSKSFIIDKH
jgi:hypothetical protein